MGQTRSVDVFMVGAGGGAYPGAFRLARAGLEVVMADPKGVLSGNCLAEGCVPSKAVRELAHHRARQGRFSGFGIGGGGGVEYDRVVRHKDQVQETRYAQHAEEMKSFPSLTLQKGVARFLDGNTLLVESDRGEDRYRARSVVIASGGEISIPPVPGASLCLTSRDFFALRPSLSSFPESLIIVGGGYIGLETACMYQALGTRVSVLEMGPRVLGGMDSGMVGDLLSLLDPDIEIRNKVTVLEIRKSRKGHDVQFRTPDGEEKVLTAEKVMMAAGRHPVIPEGLGALGVETGRRGIQVNPAMQTSLPHIFASGDVNGIAPLFHAAVRQSLVAAHNILGGGQGMDFFDPTPVPTTVFTIPEAAFVGLTPDQAKEKGLPVLSGSYRFRDDSRAQILGETGGGIRLLFEPGSLRLLGGTVVGVDAGYLIGEIGLALSGGLTAFDLARYCDQHPMASEGIGKAARSLF